MLNVNQIYTQAGVRDKEVPFKDWIEREKTIYDTRIKKGQITGNRGFVFWLNQRYTPVLNNKSADGSVADSLVNILGKTSEKLLPTTSETASEVATMQAPTEKTIFGLKPVVAYTIGGVLVVTGTFLLVKYIKWKNS